MRARIAAVLIFLLVSLPVLAREKKIYFSITTNKTFRPDEKPKLQLYVHDVNALEFRVYRVHDPLKFFQGLDDVHHFGPRYVPRENVEQRTWLERFHDWKRSWWVWIRDSFREQFSAEARAEIRDMRSGGIRSTRITGATGFAAMPILNSQQLVARWHVDLPPAYLTESSDFPMDSLPVGTYVVEATDGNYRAYTVLLVSDIALVVKSSKGRMLAFTVQRTSGVPVPDCTVTTWRQKEQAAQFTTDAQGLGEAQIPPGKQEEAEAENGPDYGSQWVLGQHGDSIALVAPYSLNLSSNPDFDWRGYVYTDRPVYRPGDTVQFKLILRKQDGDRLVFPSDRQIQVKIEDAAHNVALQKTYTLSNFGTLSGSLELPAGAALGYYSVSISKGNVNGSFQVEEYKRPEYFVKVTPAAPRLLQGSEMKATIEARYYFGEPVAGAKVKYVVHTQRSYYFAEEEGEIAEEPPTAGGGDEGTSNDQFYGEQVMEEEGKLDANGRLVITVPTSVEDKYKMDVEYRVEARVTDAANREIAGHSGFLATYGPFHLDISAQSYLYKQGDTAQFTVRALDYDKHPVSTAVHVELMRYRYGTSDTALQAIDVTTGSDGFAHFSLPTNETGSLSARATAHSNGREVIGNTWLWVTGKNVTWGEGEERTLQMVADKASYKVGDVAHVLVVGVVPDSTLLVTTEGNSVLTKRLTHADDTNLTVDVPITVESQPNVFVSAVFIRNDELYHGSKSLSVPLSERRLNLQITPAKPQFQPGEGASYKIVALDWMGKPVQAELSVGVVDDAIYAVEPDTAGDIVKAFYGERYSGIETQSSLEFYFAGEAGSRPMPLARGGGGGGGGESHHRGLAQVKATDFVQPRIRKAFPDTAFWQATVHTDSSGQATARLVFPDALTTWRTTVRAVTQDTKAGWSVNRVIVRKNLMVRLAVPRFFRAGDEVTVSAIVHNYLDSVKTARVSLDTTGLDIVSGSTQDVTVPVRGEVKVDWRVRTAAGATAAKVLTKALTNEESDAMELTLPVIPFGVKQTINASGVIAEESTERAADIKFPGSADAASRGIDIEVSPSVTGSLFGSLEYLTSFPYGCTEQTMSSFLPNVIVASALQELHIKSTVDKVRLNTQVKAGLQRLYDFQHDDGGWGWWKEDDSMVFMTAYVVAGLAQARDAGYEIDSSKLAKGQQFLTEALHRYSNMIPDLRAYVVYSLALAGNRDRKSLDAAWDDKKKLSGEGIAFVGLTMKLEGDARVNEAMEALHAASKTEGDGSYWPAAYDGLMDIPVDSSAEATAYAVKLLSQAAPTDPLLSRAVLWLMRHRNEGYYWYSTKQTAMVVYGVIDYLKVSHELEPAFTAEVQVNGKTVLTRRFTGQDVTAVNPVLVHLPADSIAAANQVTVRKNGTGRLYWSARGSYYSTDQKLYNAGGLSLSLARDYYKMSSVNRAGKIVYEVSHLNGPLQSGDILAVRVTVGGNRCKYLMVEDPIPAGTEFIERDDLYEVASRPSWWRYWFSRREFHDDRAAIFQTYFDGSHEYFYLLKVVNPGLFQISPASVQPMYQPDVLSTTGPARLEVK